MASEETAPARRRGVAMFVVLGLVIFFTMLGFMGLAMASKDSQVSGSLVDIKTKEEAAWGGLSLAIGIMQANPAATVAQLQQFIADSSVSTTSKRQWFDFSGGSFTLVGTKPDSFTTLATGGDPSGVMVRVVALDIGGATGSDTGAGITITLESTGKGRNGDQLTIVSTYRMLGIDVPVQTTTSTTGTPNYAFYLNGDLSSSNVAANVNGSTFIGGDFTGNSGGTIAIHGRLKLGGSYTSNAALTVDSSSWIQGDLSTNSGAPIIFHQSLGVGGGFSGSYNASLEVDSILNIYGSATTSSWNNAPLSVGKQLYFAQNSQSINGPLTVGVAGHPGNAYFHMGLNMNTGSNSTIYGNVVVTGNSSATSSILLQTLNVNGIAAFLGAGNITLNGSRLLVGGNARFVPQISQFNNPTAPALQVGLNVEINGGIGAISDNAPNAFWFKGTTYLNPNNLATIWFAGGATLEGPLYASSVGGIGFDKGFGQPNNPGDNSPWRFNPALPAASRTWTYYQNGNCNPSNGIGYSGMSGTSTASEPGKNPFYGGADPRVLNSLTSNSTACSTSPVIWTPVVTMAIDTPRTLSDPNGGRMRAIDTTVNATSDPMDTVYVDNTHSNTVASRMHTLTNAILTAASISSSGGMGGSIDDPNFFNKLFSYFTSQGWLVNGYMVVHVNSSMNLGNFTTYAPFIGKALWVIDAGAALEAHSNWAASAGPTNIQVLDVINGGVLQNFGVCGGGTLYGFVYYAGTTPSYTAGSFGGTGTTNTATIIGGFEIANLGSFGGSGGLTVTRSQAVFNDINSNLPGVLHSASGSGGATSVTNTSTKTLTVRGPASSVQFVRLGEYR